MKPQGYQLAEKLRQEAADTAREDRAELMRDAAAEPRRLRAPRSGAASRNP